MQIEVVRHYHRMRGYRHESLDFHSMLHVVVENQILLGDETPVAATLERLMREGLDRHQAIHALAGPLVDHLYKLAKSSDPLPSDPNAAYFAAVERMTAAGWLAMAEDDGPD